MFLLRIVARICTKSNAQLGSRAVAPDFSHSQRLAAKPPTPCGPTAAAGGSPFHQLPTERPPGDAAPPAHPQQQLSRAGTGQRSRGLDQKGPPAGLRLRSRAVRPAAPASERAAATRWRSRSAAERQRGPRRALPGTPIGAAGRQRRGPPRAGLSSAPLCSPSPGDAQRPPAPAPPGAAARDPAPAVKARSPRMPGKEGAAQLSSTLPSTGRSAPETASGMEQWCVCKGQSPGQNSAFPSPTEPPAENIPRSPHTAHPGVL